jgi:hypothetical protein
MNFRFPNHSLFNDPDPPRPSQQPRIIPLIIPLTHNQLPILHSLLNILSQSVQNKLNQPKPHPIDLNSLVLCQRESQNDKLNDLQCPICYEKRDEQEKFVRLPCHETHIFHQSCMQKWVNFGNTDCPMCRAQVSSPPSTQTTVSKS